MTESSRALYNQVLQEITNSPVDLSLKDQMKQLVFQCMKFNNGTSNDVTDIKDTLTMLSIFIIRHNLRNCGNGMESTKVGQFIRVIQPIAWPLAFVVSIALFSPHLTEVLSFIQQICK